MKELLKLAGNDSPLAGLGPDEVASLDGELRALEDEARRESYASILGRAQRDEVTVEAEAAMPLELGHWSMHSHSALFCGVRVHAVTGEVRVSRFLGSFDCGRILNAKTAASQFRGGIIMGLGLALMEEVSFDERTGRIMNPSLAEYHVPVHLDVPEIDVIWTDEPDPHAPVGARGVGEIGITGVGAYRGSGSAAHHPRMLLGVLIYGYATGVFSSRKLERATYDSVAFRYIAANDHPDHDTIAMFRRRFLEEIEGLFVRVLLLAREIGVLKMGTVGLDGTKIHANASRHGALSWDHAGKLEAQLKAEVADLLARAEAADEGDVPDGMSIPEELAVREKRLAKLAEARGKIEAQAKERYARERAEQEAKLAARAAKTAATGKKPGGKPPAPPVEGPLPKDQINLTDADSRIMPASGGGFEQSYNAQAVVAAGSLLVVAADVVQAPNDKQQLEPMLDKIEALPERLGAVETLLADAGYFSAANVEACREASLEPLIAIGRQPHHPLLDERFAKEGPAPENPTPVEAMAHRLKTPEGRKLYALRKQTPEPVFGIIKSALGFRQFSLRGLYKVRADWSLVTMAWNLKRMFVLAPG